MATEKIYKSDTAVNAEIELNIGEVTVEATSEVTRVEVWVRTADNEGQSADAVNSTEFNDRDNTLRIRTRVQGSSGVVINGGVVIGGSVSIVNGVVYSGDRVYVNDNGGVYGRDGRPAQLVAPSKVQVIVKMPLGCNLEVDTVAAHVLAEGRYHRVDLNTTSGSLDVEEAYILDAGTTSGSLTVHRVVDRADIKSVSGAVKVRKWDGDDLCVKSVSGSIKVINAQNASASGRAKLQTVSGAITLGGSKHISDVTMKTVSGSKNRV